MLEDIEQLSYQYHLYMNALIHVFSYNCESGIQTSLCVFNLHNHGLKKAISYIKSCIAKKLAETKGGIDKRKVLNEIIYSIWEYSRFDEQLKVHDSDYILTLITFDST